MVTKKIVRELLDRTEIEYRSCWATLVELKQKAISPKDRERLLDFQPRLAAALFALDELYRKIIHEERSLIPRKGSLSAAWFRRRMKSLSGYRTVLKNAMEIGRGIGDSFAWLFYAQHREYLNAHLAHEPLTHTPPGVGGRGELEFLRQIRFVGDQLAIYHGNTTFLRIGDVTLYDLKRRTITGIGEIKTTEVGTGELEIVVHVVGSPALIASLPVAQAAEEGPHALPPQMQARLQRQLKRMKQVVEVSAAQQRMNIENAAHLLELEEFAQELHNKTVAYKRVGDGLLLIGVRPRSMSFSSRLFGSSRTDYSKILHGVNRHTLEIMDSDTPDNRLVMGALDLGLIVGATPLFWWPVDIEFLRRLFFQELSVITAWNPAHIVQKLRGAGFTVEPVEDDWAFRITATIEGKVSEVVGFEYFASLVYKHLMREVAIVETLARTFEFAKSTEGESNSRVQIQLFLHWL